MKTLEFAKVLGRLKAIKRTGWLKHKISNAESVAEHSFRVAVLVMFLAKKMGVDENRAVKMALIHDIGEAHIGDVVTMIGSQVLDNLDSKIKSERKAIVKILKLVDAGEYIKLFDEYEQNKTKEARLVRQLDKLEMALQAQEYEKEHGLILEEFFETARVVVSDVYLKNILKEIESKR